MSTNDDSASRRGRRADQAEAEWRAASRSGNQYPGQNPRDSQQQAGYSGFSRQSYSQQPYSPPQQEPAPPVMPQQGRGYDVPQGYYQEPAPQVPQQPYYPEVAPQRGYVDPGSPYAPPPSPYDSAPQQVPYGAGSYGAAGGELFGRDPSMPQSFEQAPYGASPGYRADAYEPAQPHPFAARAPQESAPQYYLPEEQPLRSAPPLPAQPQYAPQQAAYSPTSYDQQLAPQANYQRGGVDPHGFDEGEMRSGRPPMAARSDDFDEEFPDEDFDGEDYGVPQKRGRKKLFAALLLSAAAVVVGGYYFNKSVLGGKGTGVPPLIKAELTPSKEVPSNPGGKQFPHGEKSIYERLTADGRTQVAPAAATASVSPGFAAAASTGSGSGSSLEDRIDEALKRAQGTGEAPSGAAGRGSEQPTVVRSESYGPDGRRLDSRPMITPNIVNVDSGNLPYPFGSGAAAATAQPAGAPLRQAPAAAPAQPQFATATAAAPAPRAAIRTARAAPPEPAEPIAAVAVPAPAGSFYVSLKSAPDEKGIQRDLPALTEKYKGVLGDVQLSTKIADLGAKGVTYRAVAGPLGTKQEAMELCTKIKGVGGDKACFVTN